jgi:hypothetical protein
MGIPIYKEPLYTIASKYCVGGVGGNEFRSNVELTRKRAELLVESLNKIHDGRIIHWVEENGVNPETSGRKRTLPDGESECEEAKRRRVDRFA